MDGDDYVWNKVATEYRVGSRQELLFWRVMNSAGGATSKDYFYSPSDYEAFSGISMELYREQIDAWNEQHVSAMTEFRHE